MPSSKSTRTRALLLIIATGAIVALARPASLDIGIAPGRAAALFRIGFATIRIAFDSGQECPKSNGLLLGAAGGPGSTGAAAEQA